MLKNNPLFDTPESRDFRENNGNILQKFDLLGHQFTRLISLRKANLELDIDVFLKSVNFLQQAGYIEIRSIESQGPVLLPDAEYTALEARVSHQGGRLLNGEIFDKMIGGYDGA